jgi:hypothetical protein
MFVAGKNSKWIVVIMVALALVVALWLLWLLTRRRVNRRDNFKILGTLAPYKDTFYQCLSECERADLSKQLTPGHGSFDCDEYCNSAITDWSRRGGPSYPSDSPVGAPIVKTRVDLSYEKCGDGSKGAWCRNLYTTASEIDEKCRQNCAYSPLPEQQCMGLCAASLSGNASSGWSWK